MSTYGVTRPQWVDRFRLNNVEHDDGLHQPITGNPDNMITSWYGNDFRITGPISQADSPLLTKGTVKWNIGDIFRQCDQAVKWTVELTVFLDIKTLMLCQRDILQYSHC